eukprot:TRINITY_DN14267_c0_g1_i1.p1 TRINITY_DN14267_c0_g1~~TRINITY_DN14267_c0_g1_i1.p1  ORF type:complete len:453 (+),score=46.20 TRINITY_DN14267_c0_g1_i1:98-1360(+)
MSNPHSVLTDAPLRSWISISVVCLGGWVALAVVHLMRCWQISNDSSQGMQAHSRCQGISCGQRTCYFDYWRTLAVACVVLCHGNEKYGSFNVVLVLSWVMPLITLISGILYGMSRSPLSVYVARLLVLFSIGSTLNWVAAVLRGKEWWKEDVPFQMSYVLMLAGAAVAASPLKALLHAEPDNMRWKRTVCMYLLFIACCLAGALLARDALRRRALIACTECGVTLLLSTLCFLLLRSSRHLNVIGWIVGIWTYVTRAAVAQQFPADEFHYVDIYIFAVVVQKVPLTGKEHLGMFFIGWWPYLIIGLRIIMPLGWDRRIDRHPPEEVGFRIAQYTCEFSAVLAFVAVPSLGLEKTQGVPETFRANSTWINRWTLFAYASHHAILQLCSEAAYPWGVMLVFALAMVFYLTGPPPNREAAGLL